MDRDIQELNSKLRALASGCGAGSPEARQWRDDVTILDDKIGTIREAVCLILQNCISIALINSYLAVGCSLGKETWRRRRFSPRPWPEDPGNAASPYSTGEFTRVSGFAWNSMELTAFRLV